MTEIKKSLPAMRVLDCLPQRMAEEITRLVLVRRGEIGQLREVRLRTEGQCSALLLNERIILCSTLNREETNSLVNALCEGALYAHRDTLASGYITIRDGIRVGVCGYARYEGGGLVGISDVRSLVFRIPTGECAFREELSEAFRGVRRGMLIYSPPGIGKTTALRSLAASLGRGASAKRVVVVDERCEFSESDYERAEVDILKGYQRRAGIEIAARTMSADVIMIDEIGADDAESIYAVMKCGIPFVATAHSASFEEVMNKPSLSRLFECQAFDRIVGISCSGGEYKLTVNEI